ncbi:hypothetical protein [Quatrionicoccus australiensis]|uniref:hypothetical protein n=1 Tax=Quatrionicoccus australiensis TaxID=138118 RepID=UPI001CFA28A9|nr:hypothetical protein [Quatrionicoccus australiensis]MCB4359567.1 hypothetical protein [Quatrionicoccus australiensis]
MPRNIRNHPKVRAWLAGAGAALSAATLHSGPVIELWFRKAHTGRVRYVLRSELLMLLAHCDFNPVPVLVTPDCVAAERGVLPVLAELFYVIPEPRAYDLLIVGCRTPADYAKLFDTRRLATMDPLLPADLREFLAIFDYEYLLDEMLSWLSDRVHQNRCEMATDAAFKAKAGEDYPLLAKGYE